MSIEAQIEAARLIVAKAIDLAATEAMLNIRRDLESARRSIGQLFRWAGHNG
jgi:hypothetical protein